MLDENDLPAEPLATIPKLALTSMQVIGKSWPVQIATGEALDAEKKNNEIRYI